MLILYLSESEARKALNGTTVTIGSMRMDLIRGRLWASNIIIHSPRRDQWRWESPVLARVGCAYVEANLVLCLMSFWFLWEELPMDVYTIHVSDIQVFIERKQNFFNFYLLDSRVELPDPQSLLEEEAPLVEVAAGEAADTLLRNASSDGGSTLGSISASLDAGDDSTSEEKAQKLMGDVLRALSRAAKEGSIEGALVEHRQKITTQLKALQTTTKKSAAMQEGVKIVQHVSKAVVEKTQTAQQIVQPARRAPFAHEKTFYIRVGRIGIRDARLFTRDHQWETPPTSTQKKSFASWNKPIFVERVDVRASELSPSLSAKDENGLPPIHQPLDRVIDIVWKRVLAEGAKSQSGRLFKTAMSEVLDYWMEKDPGNNDT